MHEPESILSVRIAESGEERSLLLRGEILRIGSSPDNDIPLTGVSVAPVHAKLVRSKSGWEIHANETEFGTFVGGQRIDRVPLRGGEEIRIGPEGPVIRIEASGEEPPQAPRLAVTQIHAAGGFAESYQTLAMRRSMELALDRSVTTIGRHPGNDIVLPHPQVSAFHAEVRSEAGGYLLVDKESRNGTFVGGGKIRTKRLERDDAVHVGPYLLIFEPGRFLLYDQSHRAQVDVQDLSVGIPGSDALLLEGISLRIAPGELVGVLGPSGAGKSTFLKALCGLRPRIGGQIRINRLDLYENYEYVKQNIGFVPQDDIIHPQLTARRTLQYVSRLRLPRDLLREERRARIEKVLALLELKGREDLPIRRLSGGQRKRISLGVELLTEPNLIFMDEPTAGLDPALESKMMVLFKELAQEGRTVVVSTHLMSSVDLFDKIVVLVRGRLAFYGTPGEARNHFGITDMRDLFQALALRPPGEWAEGYRSSAYWRRHAAPAVDPAEAEHAGHARAVRRGGRKRGRWVRGSGEAIRQFVILAQRYGEITVRDRRNLAILLLQAPVIAAFVVLAMKSTASILFMLTLAALWFGASNAAKEIVKELPVYRRERMVNLGILPYVVSKVCILLLLALVQCTLLLGVIHGLRPLEGSLPLLFGATLLCAATGLLLGLVISAMVGTTDRAISFVPLVLIPQVLFAGAFGPLTGGAGVVGWAMPSRWSYDLAKRIVLETHGGAVAPMVGLERKKAVEEEIERIGTRTVRILAEVDRSTRDFAGARDRVHDVWRDLNQEAQILRSHQRIFQAAYAEAQREFRRLEGRQKEAARALEKQRKVAREIHDEFLELRKALGENPRPEIVLKRITPDWVRAKSKQLEEVLAAYQEMQRVVGELDHARKRLEKSLAELESRARDTARSGEVFSRGRDTIEREVADLHEVVSKVLALEEELKENSRRVRALQGELADHLRAGRFIHLDARDSVRKDVLALVGFCALFFCAVLWFQRRKDRED